MGARFGRGPNDHPRGPSLPVSAGPCAPHETDIGPHSVDDLIGLAAECDS